MRDDMNKKHVNGRWCSQWVQLAVICGVAFLVYGNTLFNGFVYDDNTHVVTNEVYRRFDLWKIFFTFSNGVEYLPLRDVTYAIDYLVWGGKPVGFHLSNLIYYCGNLVAVFYFTHALLPCLGCEKNQSSLPERLIPFFTAILFAILPYHCEPVSALFTRNVLVSGLFFFMASYVFVKNVQNENGSKPVQIVGVLLLYLFSMLSKATAITLPLLFLALLFCRQQKIRLQAAAQVMIPSGILMLAALFFFKSVATQTHMIAEQGLSSWSFMERIAVALQIPVYYLGKMLVPVGFTIAYDVPFALSLASWKVAGSVALLAILGAVAIIQRKKHPELLFGLLWYLVTLLPVMNFFQTYPVVADRYFYLPSYGMVLIVVALLLKEGRWAALRQIVLAVAIILFSIISFRQNQVYHDDTALWERAVATNPSSVKSLSNLGWTYFHAGSHDKALATFLKLRQLNPADRNMELATGLYHFQRKEWKDAISPLQAALMKKEDALDTLDLLAQSYYYLGDYPKAVAYFESMLLSRESDMVGYRANAIKSIETLRMLMQEKQEHTTSGR
jgi:cytochrome c-type biogenesis protein CcmH/NrfG